MNVWQDSVLVGIYTLSPTHCGTGQTLGAVDLPIARDSCTRFPVLPATSVKGVTRKVFEQLRRTDEVKLLFGPALDDAMQEEDIRAGSLAFTEARLLLFPIRSLNRPFLHVTCPLILERFARDLRILDLHGFRPQDWVPSKLQSGQAHVVDQELAGKTLVLEDLVYNDREVAVLPGLEQFAARLGTLLPDDESDTRDRLTKGLVVIPDTDFQDLLMRVIPVRARTKLTGGKTTTEWTNPDTLEKEKGNLWYEEFLPSDCLFVSFVGERRQRLPSSEVNQAPSRETGQAPLDLFRARAEDLQVVQIGGNETVGHGWCTWTFWSPNEHGVRMP